MVWRTIVANIALLAALCGGSAASASERRIALSFDDIPRFVGPVLTRAERQRLIIEGLAKSGVTQAVFFINPAKIDDPSEHATADDVRGYVRAGHVIANHTDNHLKLGDNDAASYLVQVDAAESWLRKEAGYRPWFRYPYLDEGGADKMKRDAVRAGLKARGLTNGYVTAEASDWLMHNLWVDAYKAGKRPARADLCRFYAGKHAAAALFADDLSQRTFGRSVAQVMLLHETDLAAWCITDLVSALKADGWTIITADEAYRDPISAEQPDVPVAQGGLLEMAATARGIDEPRWYGLNKASLMTAAFRTEVLHEVGTP